MLSGDMAKYQIADRVREAEATRLARSTRRGRKLEAHDFARRVGHAALAAALWPIRH